MIREVPPPRSDWNEIPYKFEAGTPDISPQIGMGAAAEYLMGIGLDGVQAHEQELTRYAMETLAREVPGVEIYGPEAVARGGVVSFNLPGIHPHDVAQSWTAPAFASAPATTARCRSTSASIWRPRPGRASTCNSIPGRSTPWRSAA